MGVVAGFSFLARRDRFSSFSNITVTTRGALRVSLSADIVGYHETVRFTIG